MDVHAVHNKDRRVVIYGIVVLPELRKAVGSIVQCLHVVGRPVLHLICIILYSCRESFHLTVDEPTIRVDDRIRTVKLNGLVEVVDGVLESIKTTLGLEQLNLKIN